MATSFESHTHQQLLAMLASADAEILKARGAQLADAAAVLKDIGESLKDHRATGWEGESATAFQDWVSRTGNATLRLSEYSAEGGKQLTQAGQVVIEVKANMPTYDTGAEANLKAAREYHNDPDAQRIGQQAHSKLSGDREQAIQQMTKLAQGYEAAATGMEMAEVPTFPPPPATFVPEAKDGGQQIERPGGATPGVIGGAAPGAIGAGGPSYSSSPVSPSGSSSDSGPALVPQPSAGPIAAPSDRNIGTNLDTVGPTPSAALPLAPGMPGGLGPSGLGGGSPGSTPGGFVPPLTLPAGSGVQKPIGDVGPGGFGPGGTLPGPGRAGGKGGGLGGVAGLGLHLRDSGISGGRPVTPGGPDTSISRGTVIGGEGAEAGGRGMGVGGGMGMGGGGTHGGPGNSMAGRRLATELGGNVGHLGSGGRSIAGGQPFTPGGSGLVRGGPSTGTAGGPMGHIGAGVHAPGRRGDGRQGERPDYLAEDEETWQGDGRVVPPVID
ncbi:WXG100 family type VII secretion target [Streptomyces sp. NPDC006487]|uniref:WXG100 family type VII secretion target n=1 Tax=Streptomyces sp. NPDC006487 TaxID=3364748 RepID=UPI0036964616